MDSIIFRSQGYLFALSSSVIAGVSQQEDLRGISFADYFFHTYEEEMQHLILVDGYVLHVHEIVAIESLSESVPPVPGYIFESGSEWVRGILWRMEEPVFVMNETHLNEDLGNYVPELST
jgi:hypothetical protein